MEWLHLTCLTIYQSTPHLMFPCAVVLPGRLSPGLKDMSFFPYCISNWNLLDSNIKSLSTLREFKDKVCKFFRAFYKIRDKYGIKFLTEIRVNFSDLRHHRYNHNFNCQNPSCAFGLENETTVHYFLCCPRYCQLRTTYLQFIKQSGRFKKLEAFNQAM